VEDGRKLRQSLESPPKGVYDRPCRQSPSRESQCVNL
jgi:hypothetical protein